MTLRLHLLGVDFRGGLDCDGLIGPIIRLTPHSPFAKFRRFPPRVPDVEELVAMQAPQLPT